MNKQYQTLLKQYLSVLIMIFIVGVVGCGGGSDESLNPPNTLPPQGDADSDGLSNQQEVDLGTNANAVDTDNDGIWDSEEVNMFGTNPLMADSDNDGIEDGADPQPTVANQMPTDPNSGLFVEYGLFTNNANGAAQTRVTDTRFEENHVVYAPQTSPGAPFLIYQTYIEDTNLDSLFNEADLPGSAIAIRNTDGSRPRFITDIDSITGKVKSNGAIDATPEPSPDGQHIIFVSDRDNPGSFMLKLYVMDINGANPVAVSYTSNAPDNASGEFDADPSWGPNNTITFKRQVLGAEPEFSRVYTANIDTATMTLSNVVERTAGANIMLSTLNGPGDFDPKISPDGSAIVSYRHLSDIGLFFGDYDIWIGLYSSPTQPADSSVIFIDQDDSVASLFPRWNITGDKLAAWQLDNTAFSNNMDAIDIVVYSLVIQHLPFSVTATKINITPNNDGWFETMPSWNTDPRRADELIYSASRQF